MRSLKLKKLLVKAIVASVVTLSSIHVAGIAPVPVYAAQMSGTVTVTTSSLWTYSTADWNARAQVVNKGASFTISEKVNVAGRDMYGLTNGLYITANPAYVSAQETVAAPAVVYKATTASLNMRTGPGTSNSVILTLPRGAVVQVLESSNGWDKVVYSGKTGWASAQYLTTVSGPAAPVTKVIKAAQFNLNMRSGAGTSYARILTIPAGGRVEVIGSSGGWDNVIYNGKTGWASSEFLTVVNEKATGADVIDFAKTLLGIPYTWGGNTPAEGFDCSGLTKYVYANFGVTISRLTAGQAVAGTAVAISDMQLGDIIYFGNSSITHVGLYMGNNQMIHAPSPGKFVEIRDLTWHLNNYQIVGARRVLN